MSSKGGAKEVACWSRELGTQDDGIVAGCAAGDLFVHGRGLAFVCRSIRAGTGALSRASAGEGHAWGAYWIAALARGSRGPLMRL